MFLRKKMMKNARMPVGFLGKIKVKKMNTGAHEKLAQWGFDHIFLRGNEKAIDLGCGGGANIKRMLDMLPDGSVAGLDYSEVSVSYSREVNKEAIAAGRCKIIRGDVSQIPLKDEAVDLVTAFETIYFWPDLEKSFAEVFRILKQNGTFLITNESDGRQEKSIEWTRLIDGLKVYTGEELERLLKETGFTRISIDDDEAEDRLCVVAEKRL